VIRPRAMAGSAAVEVKYGLIGATDLKAAAALRKLLPLRKNGLSREVPMAEVKRYAPDLTGWVAAFATMSGYVAVDTQGPAVGPGSHKGVHGLWPTKLNYRSVFVVSGDRVRPGVHLGEISVLDVAPTLASMLGLSLPEAKQPSLWPKLKR
jgi:hypothetical protein